MAKDSKPKKKSKKSSKKSGPDAVAMKLKTPKPNPFETIWSRRKFDILGKKRKGEERRLGLARSRAVEKRSNTLLKEYEKSTKSSVFVDKRIGEQNDELEEFDKGIMRSQRVRQLKLGKRSKFNLSDGEDEENEDQTLGAFSERDDFDAGILSDDENGEGDETQRRSSIPKLRNSNKLQDSSETGLDGDENRPKSKKEVMEEIILKSKVAKMEKAKQKEENEELIDELDKSFTTLVQTQVFSSLTEPGKINALKSLVKGFSNENLKNNELPRTQAKPPNKQEPDYYDKLLSEVSMDIRARVSDRTKTPEEIAELEFKRLEMLEEDRKKRMLATDDVSDEDDENTEQPNKRPRAISGDDLGDSFSLDAETTTSRKGWVDEILEKGDAENSESEGDDDEDDDDEDDDDDDASEDEGIEEDEQSEEGDNEHEKPGSLKDWEQSDDDLGIELEDEEEHEISKREGVDEKEPRVHKKSKTNIVAKTSKQDEVPIEQKKQKASKEQPYELPFLIPAPNSFEELYALVEFCSNADVVLVIDRIRKSNPMPENRKKMQVFYGVLLQYFAVLTSKTPLNFELLNLLVKPLMEMSKQIPYFAAICARQRLLRTRTQFCESMKDQEKGCWPTLKTLFLLRLWSMIFPCSDFRHVVMTPAILLMCEYLMRCPILSGRDIAIGSFLCSMVLSVTKHSRKFCPEAIMFLQTLLIAAKDRKTSDLQSQFNYFMDIKSVSPLLVIRDRVNEIIPLNFLEVMNMPEDSPFFSSSDFSAGVLFISVATLQGFVEAHEGLNSFPEVFMPVSKLLNEMAAEENIPEALEVKLKVVSQLIKNKVDDHHRMRQPLQMRKHKPVPIKMLNPKFEENYVKGRDYDPDRERVEMKKLKKQIKQEAKGAARELRKDNYFLQEVKAKERARENEERAEKYGKALAFLQEQEHAFKSGQLGKGKNRRK